MFLVRFDTIRKRLFPMRFRLRLCPTKKYFFCFQLNRLIRS